MKSFLGRNLQKFEVTEMFKVPVPGRVPAFEKHWCNGLIFKCVSIMLNDNSKQISVFGPSTSLKLTTFDSA